MKENENKGEKVLPGRRRAEVDFTEVVKSACQDNQKKKKQREREEMVRIVDGGKRKKKNNGRRE